MHHTIYTQHIGYDMLQGSKPATGFGWKPEKPVRFRFRFRFEPTGSGFGFGSGLAKPVPFSNLRKNLFSEGTPLLGPLDTGQSQVKRLARKTRYRSLAVESF